VNLSTQTVQLMTRHWFITDGRGEVHEVRGEGVVGQQPVLRPGEASTTPPAAR
jgi:ApaG protein